MSGGLQPSSRGGLWDALGKVSPFHGVDSQGKDPMGRRLDEMTPQVPSAWKSGTERNSLPSPEPGTTPGESGPPPRHRPESSSKGECAEHFPNSPSFPGTPCPISPVIRGAAGEMSAEMEEPLPGGQQVQIQPHRSDALWGPGSSHPASVSPSVKCECPLPSGLYEAQRASSLPHRIKSGSDC